MNSDSLFSGLLYVMSIDEEVRQAETQKGVLKGFQVLIIFFQRKNLLN